MGELLLGIKTNFLIIISVVILISSVTFIIGDFNADMAVNNVLDQASRKGMLTQVAYDHLSKEVNKYGDFEIVLAYGVLIEEGGADEEDYYDWYFDKSQIINAEMQSGDLIRIYLNDRKEPLISKIRSALPFSTKVNYTLHKRADVTRMVTKTFTK